SGEVEDTQEIGNAMGELSIILEGPGLLKPRHTPVVLSMLDDLIADMHRYGDPLLPPEQELVGELSKVAGRLRDGSVVPPIGGGQNLPPLRRKILEAERFEKIFPPLTTKDNFITVSRNISLPLFHGWCPYPAAKPLLPAPVAGLSETPPDMTLYRDLIQTRVTPRCLVPGFGGATFSDEWKEALWARFFTEAPARLRRSVERYSIVKRA
ncbi:MAG TPA: hypothetical protein VF286_04200, partial [Acidiphilium sp.]